MSRTKERIQNKKFSKSSNVLETKKKIPLQHSWEGRELPVDITTTLDSLTKQRSQDHFKSYKRELTKYYNDEWTVTEDINKSFIRKLKAYMVDTTQLVNAYYKGSEILRSQGRATTEIYEQLLTIKEGNLSPTETNQPLEEALECTKRAAVYT